MSDNIVDFSARIASLTAHEGEIELDNFLLTEGFDLLASFRLIADEGVRASILQMVKAVSQVSGMAI